MYWICLTREELDLAITALTFYYADGWGNDEEEAEGRKMLDLSDKLELIRDHDKQDAPGEAGQERRG